MRSAASRHAFVAAALAACLLSSAHAQDKKSAAKVDPAKGQQIAGTVCAACHGADGNSAINANPKLAGQHPEYLYRQLVDYTLKAGAKKPARDNAVMTGFASALSDEDKKNVAAWFASQKLKPGVARNKEWLELGQRIYRAGAADRAVPACSGCHGPSGSGIPTQYPRLAGQHAEYTEAQLKAFQTGARANNLTMITVAKNLTEPEIKAVSDYIAGLR
jgi:cytochrome c553